ncbi:hypothetical protein ENSA5_09090 [Enhygromyxa salina]|uniref:Uncharacterized protein n=1 Tax=Enhygromyxa salina TaxID=215803 RepID=A0A2S9YGN0_9BACT|nr:ferritin-like domain-containing protein [Enhygromyxa salina]PRQ04260.1 hypothetical protein ENSA5_09090 [Enhygromyxa salina]
MKTKLDGATLTILAALGLELACVGRTGGSDEGDTGTDDSAETEGTAEAGTSTTGDGDGDSGDGDGDSGDGDGDTGPDPDPFTCENPTPILQAGTDTPSGFVECEGGFIHRTEAVECVAPTGPDTPFCADGIGGGCETAADCNEKAYGSCTDDPWGGCQCRYGCASDADCEQGYACACAGVIGDAAQCIPAGCTITDDCGEGHCGLSEFQGICDNFHELACAAPDAECHVNSDCGEDLCDPNWPEGGNVMFHCTAGGDEGYTCEAPEWCDGDCGRPFFIEGEARVAPTLARADWELPVRVAPVDAHTRRQLAQHWTQVAQFEHASVASFARFGLQLMRLGAPPRLLLDTQRAAADELRHARVAFGLASAYAGAPVGPGLLDIDGSLEAGHAPREIVEGLVLEACIGETLAALEAREAAAQASDPAVAAALEQIASDELRHAELGWRALRWILDRGDAQLRAFAVARLDAVCAAVNAQTLSDGVPLSLRRHGVLDDTLREEVRRRGVESVIGPCVAALRGHFAPSPASRSAATS